ncbi:aryl-alcohol dehydrogenase [Aspergillus uvarum CBS 121591]|uniref:Aryl-alcohol dehydrogenase n=1 Tax=Aspergillus uvarum CBS 121591 TaxID=1448315 RepID=A0A319C8P3_9EURO|nr:aryl-alcohol dehydrogenase [Aspergillus uvarum CBS 121591]PYH80309.1 aryl-alcohol dehydrogenase [Aspergillus uvarum CBS 121591]
MTTGTASLSDLRQSYDYLVVGGGTAGLVVANRLTEDPTVSALVLEAGSNRVDDPRIAVPGLAASTYFDPEFDWCLTSPPQEALNGRCIAEPRGRTLGGSSAINLGMAIYPSRSDIDTWEQLGNAGWNWESLSRYLRKSQTFTPPSDEIRDQLSLGYIDPAIQGTDGPIHVSFGEGPFPTFNSAWPRTFETLSHCITGDPMSGQASGAFVNPGTVHATSRARSHAGVAYYNPEIAQRPNLRVVTEALVEKILLKKPDHGEVNATGVQFVGKDGERRTVHAGAEVILAAGAVKTPHLLELSGIGNADLLQTHGIEALVDNPNVGENLQEHGFVPFSWEVADGQITGEALRNPEIAQAAMQAWQASGAGPLGLCPISSAFLTLPGLQDGELQALLDKYLDDEEVPPNRAAQYRLLRRLLEDPEEPTGQYTLAPFQITPEKGPSPKGIFAMTEPECFVSIVAVLNRPFSRGSVHLASADATALPTFDPQLLAHPLDVELQARHVHWLETVAETEPMASLLKPDGRRLHHPERVSDLETARRLTRDRIVAHYHVVGTTAMLPQEIGGVVDDKLRVYGCRKLRVVDAGVIPLIPRGNIQATVFAVAEKAADIIKESRQ